MNWLIIGQGAIGLLWYHHLQQYTRLNNSSEITSLSLLASKNHDHSQKNYQYTSLEQDIFQGKIKYATHTQLQSADTIFLCLKSYQITFAIQQISAHIKTDANIILAHNGMGTLEELSPNFTKTHPIYVLITTHGCLRSKPLTITHTGAGKSELGLLFGHNNPRIEKVLSSTLHNALSPTIFAVDITKKQWLKLAINCVINPITALHNINNGLVNNHQFTEQRKQIITELVAVAKAEGIHLSISDLNDNVQLVAQATASNCSSMRCDVLANRQTEIDYINGYIHRLGIKHNIKTPENSKNYHHVKALLTAK
ncbi:MAG: 2-dehydropantoate 2-reductase [Litorilituus sp.]|nr:2-dehydropantoate 2-reductase [Litorilituus sp.]